MQNSQGPWPQHNPTDPSVPLTLPFQEPRRPLLQPPMQQVSHHHLGYFVHPMNPNVPNVPNVNPNLNVNPNVLNVNGNLNVLNGNVNPNVHMIKSPVHSRYVPSNGRLHPPVPQGLKMEENMEPVPEMLVVDNAKTDRQRIRVNRACERCRFHKIKCTGLHPCRNCSKHNIECVFRSSKLNSETSITKKRRADDEEFTSPLSKLLESPPDYAESPVKTESEKLGDGAYTAYLENRVQYLENLLARRITGTEAVGYPEDRRLKDVMEILTPTLTKWKVARRVHSALAIQLCQSLYDSLSVEAREGLSVPRTNHYGWNMSGCNYLKLEGLPAAPDMSGIPHQRQMDFLEFFFREINPTYAILHESVFRTQFEAFQKLQSDEPASNNTALFRAMISLVFALSIRFGEFMKGSGPSMEMLRLEESLFKYGYRTVQLFTQEWESFELIQCWLLTTLYLRITHRQTSCFYALGNAVNMCRGMGLGKYESIIPDIKPYTKLKAQRIFYSVFIFDRVIGLQGGRFRSLSDLEITRAFPLLQHISGAFTDGWSTLPALAMIHISRLSSFMEISISNDEDRSKAELIEKEFLVLEAFLEKAGFNDLDNSRLHLEDLPVISPMVKAQVRLHYYELIQSVHGKGLFKYFGQNVSIEGMDLGRVFEANKNIMSTFKKLEELSCLTAPWYLTLSSLLTVGITSLVFMHVRSNLQESRALLNESIAFLKKLQNSPVRDERGKLVFRQRFKMAEECVWLIKMINHLMILSFEQSIKSLAELGTDHGPAAVNKRLFLQFGWEGGKPGGLDHLINQRNESEGENRQDWSTYSGLVMDSSPESCVSQPKSTTLAAEEFLENFAWFEQWMDSGEDL